MIDISFEPVAYAPGVFTSERLALLVRAIEFVQWCTDGPHYLQPNAMQKARPPGLSRTAGPGFDAVAFGLSGIWDAAEDLTSRAWDAISDVLTNEGGGGGGGGGGPCSRHRERGRSRNCHNHSGAGTVQVNGTTRKRRRRREPRRRRLGGRIYPRPAACLRCRRVGITRPHCRTDPPEGSADRLGP